MTSTRRRGLLSRFCATALVAATCGLSLAACRDATEITLRVHTNLPCHDEASWKGVAVYVGKPGKDVEEAAPTLVEDECDEDGNVGSLVIVPSGSKTSSIGVRVVAGIEVAPDDCKDNDDYTGCVVARRTLRFNPHQDLELNVELTSDCVSVGCDETHSCRAGSCQATASIPPEEEPEALDPAEPSVRCGDDGVRCPTSGNVCCLSVDVESGTTKGDCRPSEACPSENIVLQCDDDTDCDAPIQYCNLSYQRISNDRPWVPGSIAHSRCVAATIDGAGTNTGLGLCQKRENCVDNRFACERTSAEMGNSLLPGYFWCRVYLN